MRPAIAFHPSSSSEAPAIDRRDSRRIETNDPAMIRLLHPSRPGQRLVRILDASQHGLKLACAEALHPGTLVHLRMEDSAVIAEVRHCSATVTGFVVGLRVDSVTPIR